MKKLLLAALVGTILVGCDDDTYVYEVPVERETPVQDRLPMDGSLLPPEPDTWYIVDSTEGEMGTFELHAYNGDRPLTGDQMSPDNAAMVSTAITPDYEVVRMYQEHDYEDKRVVPKVDSRLVETVHYLDTDTYSQAMHYTSDDDILSIALTPSWAKFDYVIFTEDNPEGLMGSCSAIEGWDNVQCDGLEKPFDGQYISDWFLGDAKFSTDISSLVVEQLQPIWDGEPCTAPECIPFTPINPTPEEQCLADGGYWYDDTCNGEPKPVLTPEEQCLADGGYWNGECHDPEVFHGIDPSEILVKHHNDYMDNYTDETWTEKCEWEMETRNIGYILAVEANLYGQRVYACLGKNETGISWANWVLGSYAARYIKELEREVTPVSQYTGDEMCFAITNSADHLYNYLGTGHYKAECNRTLGDIRPINEDDVLPICQGDGGTTVEYNWEGVGNFKCLQ